MPIYNRLVTKGFSKNTRNTLIGKGHIKEFIDLTKRVLRIFGSSALKKEIRRNLDDDFTIKASVAKVNKKYVDNRISNTLHVTIPANTKISVRSSKNIKTSITDALNTILIKAGVSKWK